MTALDELRVEVVAIDVVKPDPHNARAHPDRNLDAIEGSLRRFGQRRPLVVTRSGVIVAGNGTWLVARDRLGWTEIAITRFPSDDPDEVKAYALVDNRTAELATWDNDALVEQVGQLEVAGWDMTALGFDKAPVFGPTDDENPRLDQRAPIECPQCGYLWRVGPDGTPVDVHPP